MYSDNKREKLKETILSRYGSQVHVVGDDETIEMWASRGQFMSGEISIIEDGPEMMCHYNSLNFYLNNDDIKICTGFAINLNSNHKVWVRHSWCIDKEGIVHECTPIKRDMYFGTILDEKESEQFRKDWDYEYSEQVSKKKNTTIQEFKNELSTTDIEKRTSRFKFRKQSCNYPNF